MARSALAEPVHESTVLRFSLGTPAHVRLSLYDVGGRLVRVLMDRERPAGSYDAPWNGLDASGHAAPGGIYFAKLEAGDLLATRKLVRLAPR